MEKESASTTTIYGEHTKQLWNIFQHFTRSSCLSVSHVRSAFHAMHLYPTKSQVYEMMECAGQCTMPHPPPVTREGASGHHTASRRSHVSEIKRDFLTFGEFCVFASQLQRQYRTSAAEPFLISKSIGKKYLEKNRKLRAGSFKSYEVFLGGSCNPTTWRMDVVIPLLKREKITYYNPQVTDWVPEMIELEDQAKQAAQLLFFVIDNQTRSIASVVESSYLIGCGRQVLLVIKPWQDTVAYVFGERISEKERESLRRGQAFLHDISEYSGTPVFDGIETALSCAVKVVKEKVKVQLLTLSDSAIPIKNGHLHVGDKLLSLREAFDSTRPSDSDTLGESDLRLASRSVGVEDLPPLVKLNNKSDFTFEDFCCIFTEYKDKQQVNANKALAFIFHYLISPMLFLFSLPLTFFKSWLMSFPPIQDLANHLQLLSLSLPRSTSPVRDVYLGGNLDGSWRDERAIPLLLKHGITYYNAEQCIWTNRLLPLESVAKHRSKLLLFVISNKSRALAAMTEAAYYIGQGCSVVLCVQHLSQDVEIDGETLSRQAVKDYNRGRTYLADIANREGVPVFEDIDEAITAAINTIKNGQQRNNYTKPKIY